jgi:hypothetical protein
VTNPFAPLSSGGSWLKPAERNGHLVIISNAQFVGRKYDEMRKAEVDVVKFDLADLSQPGEGWITGMQSSHSGVTNKLAAILGNPEGKALGVIGQVQANNGHLAWVLAEAPAEAVQSAVAWLNANPAPKAAPAFAPLAPAPVVAPQTPAFAPGGRVTPSHPGRRPGAGCRAPAGRRRAAGPAPGRAGLTDWAPAGVAPEAPAGARSPTFHQRRRRPAP